MNTDRFPRTLNEAFGPYCDNRIHEEPPTDWDGIFIVVVCILFVLGACLWKML